MYRRSSNYLIGLLALALSSCGSQGYFEETVSPVNTTPNGVEYRLRSKPTEVISNGSKTYSITAETIRGRAFKSWLVEDSGNDGPGKVKIRYNCEVMGCDLIINPEGDRVIAGAIVIN